LLVAIAVAGCRLPFPALAPLPDPVAVGLVCHTRWFLGQFLMAKTAGDGCVISMRGIPGAMFGLPARYPLQTAMPALIYGLALGQIPPTPYNFSFIY